MGRCLVLIALVAALSGCGTIETKREVVTETKYVVRTATAAQKQLPPYPAPINVDKATQLDVAAWISANEKRQQQLEAIITELVKFYEAPVAAAAPPASGASK